MSEARQWPPDPAAEEGPAVLTCGQRLVELYEMVRHVAHGPLGGVSRPLAGGVIQLARRLLDRHGVKRDEDIPDVECPHCGKPVDAPAEQAEGAEGPVGEKVAGRQSEPWRTGV